MEGTAYRVIRVLGAGGMGQVLEVEHQALGLHRAMKVIQATSGRAPDLTRRLIREARALAQVQHPGLVSIIDLGETSSGEVFLVLELLRGASLRQLLRQGRPPCAVALVIVKELLEALTAVHARGMLHRDLKPENTFLTEEGRVKLLDLGLVKLLASATLEGETTSLTSTNAMLGTPRYMPPEVALGQPLDARSDLFSVGLLLWELLVGAHPFGALPGAQALTRATLDGVPPLPPLGDEAEKVSQLLAPLVKQACARNPGDRFESGEHFLRALAAPLAALGEAPAHVSGWIAHWAQEQQRARDAESPADARRAASPVAEVPQGATEPLSTLPELPRPRGFAEPPKGAPKEPASPGRLDSPFVRTPRSPTAQQDDLVTLAPASEETLSSESPLAPASEETLSSESPLAPASEEALSSEHRPPPSRSVLWGLLGVFMVAVISAVASAMGHLSPTLSSASVPTALGSAREGPPSSLLPPLPSEGPRALEITRSALVPSASASSVIPGHGLLPPMSTAGPASHASPGATVVVPRHDRLPGMPRSGL